MLLPKNMAHLLKHRLCKKGCKGCHNPTKGLHRHQESRHGGIVIVVVVKLVLETVAIELDVPVGQVFDEGKEVRKNLVDVVGPHTSLDSGNDSPQA